MSGRARPASAARARHGSSRPARCRPRARGANGFRGGGASRRSNRSRAWLRPGRSRRGGRAAERPAASSWALLLDQPHPVLQLSQPELELLVLAPRDETELAEERGEGRPGALAHAHRIAAPAAHHIVDELAGVVARQLAAADELLHELVRALLRQRDRADAGEQRLLGEAAEGLSGVRGATWLVHGVSLGAAFAAPLVSRRRSSRRPARCVRRPRAPVRPAPPRGPEAAPRPRECRGRRPSRGAPRSSAWRTPARAP